MTPDAPDTSPRSGCHRSLGHQLTSGPCSSLLACFFGPSDGGTSGDAADGGQLVNRALGRADASAEAIRTPSLRCGWGRHRTDGAARAVHASEVAAVAVPLLPGACPRRALAVIVVDEPLRVRASGRRERTHRRGGARISIAGERRRIGAGGSQQQAPIDIRPDRTIGSGVAEPTVEARSARTAGVDLSAVQGALLPYAES